MRVIHRTVRILPWVLGSMLLLGLLFVGLARIQRLVEAPGEVRIERYEVVRPSLAGLVQEVGTEPGQWVEEGQVLVRLHDYAFERDLASARQQLEEAKTRIEKLRLESRLQRQLIHPLQIERQKSAVERGGLDTELAASRVVEAQLDLQAARERHLQTKDLADEGLISQRELEELRQKELAAEQRFLQAKIEAQKAHLEQPGLRTDLDLLANEQHRLLAGIEAEIAELEVQVVEGRALVERLEALQEQHTLRASMGGLVLGPSTTDLLGQYVQAGQDLFTIIDTSSIQFITRVPEQALVRVRSGQAAKIEIAGLPKDQFRVFSGQVAKVLQEPQVPVGAAGPAAPVYPVQIALDEPWIPMDEGRFYLRGGMRGTAKISYRGDVAILRALYEFLIGRPQLPDAPPNATEKPVKTADMAARPLPAL